MRILISLAESYLYKSGFAVIATLKVRYWSQVNLEWDKETGCFKNENQILGLRQKQATSPSALKMWFSVSLFVRVDWNFHFIKL
jgi:hypothetical protein